jgi:glycosyltransferase involved in cell wall biosynthesis
MPTATQQNEAESPPTTKCDSTLGIVTEMCIYRWQDRTYLCFTLGRVLEALAKRYEKVLLCGPTAFGEPGQDSNHVVQADNVQLVPQPRYSRMQQTLWHPAAIVTAYARTLRQAEHVFVRGMLPFAGLFYLLAYHSGRLPVHWIVGNPIGLLHSHSRLGWLKDSLGLAYAYQDRLFTQFGRRLTHGTFLCNGEEIANIYASPKTRVVASSTTTDEEFYVREDTCLDDKISLLFIGFIRPEKGVEYLIEALPRVRSGRPLRLTIIGACEHYQDYRERLGALVHRLGIGHQVDWLGHVPYGPRLFEHLRRHDILVLPSLSEGTPHVLVEARANSVPVIATRVGGIPTSVTDGVDGLLVPPKDPAAIAAGIDRIIADGELRRSLIVNGLRSARSMTMNCFVDEVYRCLGERAG